MTTDEALKQLFSQRGWHKGTGFNESSARSYKNSFSKGKLVMETKIKILKACGFKLVQEMNWEK